MLCPKCGYNSFEYNKICPQCHKDLSAVRRQLFLTEPAPARVNFFKDKTVEAPSLDGAPPYEPLVDPNKK
jgi:hypothetical protein